MRTGKEDKISTHFHGGKKFESGTDGRLEKMTLTTYQVKGYIHNKYEWTTRFLHFIASDFGIFYFEDTYRIFA